MDAVAIIKETVDIRQMCERYGVSFNHRGQACCPFHDDQNPSASIKSGRFHCYVCNLHLDVIDFAGQIYGCDFREALRHINEDFGLRLDLDKPVPTAEMCRLMEERKRRQKALNAYRREYLAKQREYIAIRDMPVPTTDDAAGIYARRQGRKEYLEEWFYTNHWR